MKPPEPARPKDEGEPENARERFQELARQLLSVPKAEIDAEAKKYEREKQKRSAKKSPAKR